jgi:hypothetical protein
MIRGTGSAAARPRAPTIEVGCDRPLSPDGLRFGSLAPVAAPHRAAVERLPLKCSPSPTATTAPTTAASSTSVSILLSPGFVLPDPLEAAGALEAAELEAEADADATVEADERAAGDCTADAATTGGGVAVTVDVRSAPDPEPAALVATTLIV